MSDAPTQPVQTAEEAAALSARVSTPETDGILENITMAAKGGLRHMECMVYSHNFKSVRLFLQERGFEIRNSRCGDVDTSFTILW